MIEAMEPIKHLALETYNITLNRELFINQWAQERFELHFSWFSTTN